MTIEEIAKLDDDALIAKYFEEYNRVSLDVNRPREIKMVDGVFKIFVQSDSEPFWESRESFVQLVDWMTKRPSGVVIALRNVAVSFSGIPEIGPEDDVSAEEFARRSRNLFYASEYLRLASLAASGHFKSVGMILNDMPHVAKMACPQHVIDYLRKSITK